MIKIEYEIRDKIGKYNLFKDKLNNNIIPAIIYGNNYKNINIYIKSKFSIKIKNIINNNINENILLINNNNNIIVYIKDFQIHPIKNLIIHIDFNLMHS